MKLIRPALLACLLVLGLAACGASNPPSVNDGDIPSQLDVIQVDRPDGEVMNCVVFQQNEGGYHEGYGWFGISCDWGLETWNGGEGS